MQRLFCLCLLCMIGMVSGPTTAFAQQGPDTVSFSQEELDQLLAPVALYPDPLLSQVLIASSYPLEVVQAARFVRQYPSLQGAALSNAAANQPWDASVKALLQFPTILFMMDEQLAWTEKLGDAFIAQQDAVMDTVQALRARAQAAGTLRSTAQQRVIMEDGAIDIEPYAPDLIYVPYYNPTVVYGGWWWPDRPPMVWLPPPAYRSYGYGNAIVAGIAFGVGVAIIDTLFIDARPDWRGHRVLIGNGGGNRARGGAAVVWNHNPAHRLGVPYRDLAIRNRYRPAPAGSNRDAYRGHVAGPAPQSVAPERRVVPQPQPQAHPFIPAGAGNLIQSHAERGRASREASGFNAGGARFAPAAPAAGNHAGNAQLRDGGAGREQQHKSSR